MTINSLKLVFLSCVLTLITASGFSQSDKDSYGAVGAAFHYIISNPNTTHTNSATGATTTGTAKKPAFISLSYHYMKELKNGLYFKPDINLTFGIGNEFILELPNDIVAGYEYRPVQVNLLIGKNIAGKLLGVHAGPGIGINLKSKENNKSLFSGYGVSKKESPFFVAMVGGVSVALNHVVIFGNFQSDFTKFKSTHVNTSNSNISINLELPRRVFTLGMAMTFAR